MDMRSKAGLAASALLLTFLSPQPVAAQVAAPPPGLDCTNWADNEPAALARAKACRKEIPVKSLTSETALVTAQPAGHMRMELALEPKRVKRGTEWVPTDNNLKHGADGSVAPVASVMDVKFSGGGRKPLITVNVGGKTASWTWPRALPAPSLDGDTAVYAEVFTGVDLRVRATTTGFTQVFVVKNAAAAANPELRRIRYGFTGSGLSAKRNAVGTVDIVDGQGRSVMAGGSGHAWDSTDEIAVSAKTAAAMGLSHGDAIRGLPSSATAPGDHAKTASVQVEASATEVTTVPDPSLLTSPTAKYPLYIDPPVNLTRGDGRQIWAYANQYGVTNNDSVARVGYSPTSGHGAWRSYFVYNIDNLYGKHILAVKMRSMLYHSNRCVPDPTWMYLTNPIPVGDGGAIPWSQRPNNNAYVAESWGNANKGNICSGGNQPNMPMEFTSADLRAHLAWAVDNRLSPFNTVLTGLNPGNGNESNVNTWKKFLWGDTSLTVEYNTPPTVGDVTTDPATSCVDGGGSSPSASAPMLNDTTPDLRVRVYDADSGEVDLRAQFELQRWSGSAWTAHATLNGSVAGSTGNQSSATPSLTANNTYRWRAKALDPWTLLDGSASGTDESAYTPGWCEFKVDGQPPTVAVSAPEYPANCAPCGGIGTTGRFTITTSDTDVVKFFWGFSNPPANEIVTSGGAARSFDWTPSTGGYRILYVRAEDSAFNRGDATYAFTVDGADPLRARWRLVEQPDEDTGVITPVDSGGTGFTATVQGGGGVGNGRFPGATALTFDGTDDQIVTSGPVIADTSRSFSVSAWVKLGSKTAGTRRILSQDGGSGNSAFILQYVPSNDDWRVTVPNQSGTGSRTVNSAAGAPKLGQWTHLAVSYDSAGGLLRLYVNGVSVQATSGVATWVATGPFRIGQGFHGSISDVKVWQRVLHASEVKDMTDPLGEARVGEYHFGEVDSMYANDSSGYGHRLFLTGGASIPASGAGYDGTGLLLFDGTGKAEATGASVFSSQSFTASAWVRLDGSTLPTTNRTAVSQSGANVSGFYLGYQHQTSDSTGRWRFTVAGADVAGDSTGNAALSAPITTSTLGQWVHLQGTYDAATGSVRLYVNGSLAGQATRTTAMFDTVGGLTVGAAKWTPAGGSTAYTDNWNGAIDEVKVYAGVVPITLGDWRFDSCTGTPVVCADVATPARPVTLSGDATWTPTGQGESSGLATNGTGYAATASSPVDTSKSFTVSAWVNPTTSVGHHCAVCFDGNRVDSFVLGINGEGRWGFWAHHSDADSSPHTAVYSTSAVEVNKWTHLTAQYDAVQGKLSLYVNGQLAATPVSYTGGWNATGPMVIGRERWNGTSSSFWRGRIDDVKLFTGIVASPVAIIDPRPPAPPAPAPTPTPTPSASPTPTPTSAPLAGHWKLNEIAGTTAADSAGTHPGTLSSGVTWASDTTRDQVAHFDGTGTVDMGGPVVDTTSGYTVSTWVRMGSKSADVATVWMPGQNDLTTFKLAYQSSSDMWNVYSGAPIPGGGHEWVNCFTPAGLAPLNTWIHVAATVDPQSSTVKLYIDGTLRCTGTVSTTAVMNNQATGMALSSYWGGANLSGDLSDVRVYSRALSAAGITALYQGQTPIS